ncbi:hypothetical protein K3495_g4438 [Podosphaera aphanis]|nr:hypothetical protein K3495_g4438 [Podosphaera aphanis]
MYIGNGWNPCLEQLVLYPEHDNNPQARRCTRRTQRMDCSCDEETVAHLNFDSTGIIRSNQRVQD